MHPTRVVLLSLTLSLTGPSIASSQEPIFWPRFPQPEVHRSLGDAAWVSGGFAASAFLVLPLDQAVRGRARGSTLQQSRTLARLNDSFRVLGEQPPLFATAAMWLGGWALGQDGAEDAGLHMTEALAANTAITWIAKRLVGRARPYVDEHNARDFEPLSGFRSDDRRSFPSGHSSSAFAFAAAVATEADEAWGEGGLYFSVPLVLAATVTATSRVVDDQHWLSDVVFGAALGSLVGVAVMRANGH